MPQDQVFRLILAAELLATLPVGLYHRIRSQEAREPLDRCQEGLFILLTLRSVGLAEILGFLA